jgi:transcriptional regulator with XRE-family HTH domain
MPKRKYQLPETKELFRERLIRLRKAAGLSQKEFAQNVGISPRMATYYENESNHPPTHLLAVFAKVLGVSADQLLGIEKITFKNRPRDIGLWQRFSEVEKLPPQERRQIAQYLDTFLEREKLLQEKQNKA